MNILLPKNNWPFGCLCERVCLLVVTENKVFEKSVSDVKRVHQDVVLYIFVINSLISIFVCIFFTFK